MCLKITKTKIVKLTHHWPVCVCSLQYKYMKLVASAGGSGTIQMPAAETCALDDGEDEDEDDFDDDDDFTAAKVRKGARFFHKMKMSSGPNGDRKVRHGCCCSGHQKLRDYCIGFDSWEGFIFLIHAVFRCLWPVLVIPTAADFVQDVFRRVVQIGLMMVIIIIIIK